MIDLYTWTTPNGFKALLALEELGLPYTTHWVDITAGEQMKPAYLAINPNNKIPAIRDPDGPDGRPITVFESGAVLLYLADKTGKLLPPTGAARYTALEWMFFNVGGPGPMMGQLGFFSKFSPEKIPLAIDRFSKETERLLRVLDGRLDQTRYLGGDEYTMADVINVTWPRAARGMLGVNFAPYPNVVRWIDEIEARPAAQRAFAKKPGA